MQLSSIRSSWVRGVAAIELALLMPLFMLPLFFGVIELGRALYEYNTVVKGVRDAARYLSQYAPNTQQGAARNLVMYGSTASQGSSYLAPGFADMTPNTDIAIAYPVVSGVSGTRRYVQVTVSNYRYTLLLGIYVPFADITFGPIRAEFAHPI